MNILREIFPQVDERLLRGAILSHPTDLSEAIDWILQEIVPESEQEVLQAERDVIFAPNGNLPEVDVDDSGTPLSEHSEEVINVPESSTVEVIVTLPVENTCPITDEGTRINTRVADSTISTAVSEPVNLISGMFSAMTIADSVNNNPIDITATEDSIFVAPESVETERNPKNTLLSVNSGAVDNQAAELLNPVNAESNIGPDLANLDPGEGPVQAGEKNLQETSSFVHVTPAANREGENGTEAENDMFLSQSRLNLGSMTASRVEQLTSMVETSLEKKDELVCLFSEAKVLLEDACMAEREAQRAEMEAKKSGSAAMATVAEIRKDLERAKEAMEVKAGEICGEQAVLSSETQSLLDRLADMEQQRSDSISEVNQMIFLLKRRIAAAKARESEATEAASWRERDALAVLARETEGLQRLKEKSDELEGEAARCSQFREVLTECGSNVEKLQKDIWEVRDQISVMKLAVESRENDTLTKLDNPAPNYIKNVPNPSEEAMATGSVSRSMADFGVALSETFSPRFASNHGEFGPFSPTGVDLEERERVGGEMENGTRSTEPDWQLL